jgi:hypothetical protein
MTAEEVRMHSELLSVLAGEREKGRHLAVLHRLAQLYQHPSLLAGGWEDLSVPQLVAASSKMQRVLTTVHEICSRGEKVIIFARHLEMQRLLQRVMSEEFRTPVSVINGSTSRGKGLNTSSNSTGRARNERRHILDRFREQPGFSAIILSPFVAGIGLTITEANNVIHYGRWWNPAVEAQATDRAYRIGQTRNVSVYLPILRDVTGHIGDSFDVCLDNLLTRKAVQARDFLHPSDAEDKSASELCDMLEGQEHTNGINESPALTRQDLDRLRSSDFEAVVAALYESRGFNVVLTANGGDAGADVIAVRGRKECVLIQAKHSVHRRPVDEAAINDVLAACDVYGHRLKVQWKASVVSNADMTAAAIREASVLGVELLAGDRLVREVTERSINHGSVAAHAAQRCSSFDDGIRKAAVFLT